MEECQPQNIGENTPYFTISELSKAIKVTVEGAFEFVRVRAEISRPTRAASGHLYFTLKDDRSTLAAVCWKTVAGQLAVQPEEGLEVIASGRLTGGDCIRSFDDLCRAVEISDYCLTNGSGW